MSGCIGRRGKKASKSAASKSKTKQAKATYVIVRCRDAGVHAGEYVSHSGREVILANARRIWYWDGAASLNEIAVHGCSKPGNCKIALAVPRITLPEACEIIECETAGEAFLREVVPWTA